MSIDSLYGVIAGFTVLGVIVLGVAMGIQIQEKYGDDRNYSLCLSTTHGGGVISGCHGGLTKEEYLEALEEQLTQ